MKVRRFALIICFCDIWKTFICRGDAVPSWSLDWCSTIIWYI